MMSTTTTPALDAIDHAVIDLFDPRCNALLAARRAQRDLRLADDVGRIPSCWTNALVHLPVMFTPGARAAMPIGRRAPR